MYLTGVERVEGNDAGAMVGGDGRKLLLHSTEGSTIAGAIGAYRTRNVWPHLTVDCPERKAVQHLSLTRAGRSLRNEAGGVETNRAGRILVQIELVGFAGTPSSIGDPDDLDWFGREIVRPIHLLTGFPLMTLVEWVAYPASYGESARQRVPAARWASLSGVVGHQHAPENDHGDPGALDVARIIAAARNDQEDDMTPAECLTVVRGETQRLAQYLTTGQGNQAFNPNTQPWMPGAVTLPRLLAAVRAEGGDVNETEIAELVLASLTPAAIAAAIPVAQAEAVANELAARLTS